MGWWWVGALSPDILGGNGVLGVRLVGSPKTEWNFPFLLIQPGALDSRNFGKPRGPLGDPERVQGGGEDHATDLASFSLSSSNKYYLSHGAPSNHLPNPVSIHVQLPHLLPRKCFLSNGEDYVPKIPCGRRIPQLRGL